MPSLARRRVFLGLIALSWLGMAALGVAVVRVWRESGGALPGFDAPPEDEEPWGEDGFTVVDPVAGFRPRRNFVGRLRMGPLGGKRGLTNASRTTSGSSAART